MSREDFEKEHKQLLRAQVVMYDNMEKMGHNMEMLAGNIDRMAQTMDRMGQDIKAQGLNIDKLRRRERKTEIHLHEITGKLNGLIAWSEQTQRENELRFRRLEEKQ